MVLLVSNTSSSTRSDAADVVLLLAYDWSVNEQVLSDVMIFCIEQWNIHT